MLSFKFQYESFGNNSNCLVISLFEFVNLQFRAIKMDNCIFQVSYFPTFFIRVESINVIVANAILVFNQ